MKRIIIYIGFVLMMLVSVSKASDIDKSHKEADRIENSFGTELKLSDHSLNSYLKYSTSNSPELKAAFYNWKTETERASLSGKLNDPIFSFSYFVENIETRVGPQQQKISLIQKIPWFGKLGNAKDAGYHRSQAAYLKFLDIKHSLFFKIKSAYYNYYLTGQKEKILSDNFELLKLWESLIDVKYQTGERSQADLIRVQVELGKLERTIELLKSQRHYNQSVLKNLLNLNDTVTLSIPKKIEFSEAEYDFDEIRQSALENNFSLKRQQEIILSREADLKYANKLSYPDFALGISLINTGNALDPLMLDSGKDPISVSLTMNLPFLWGKSSSKQKIGRSEYKKAEYKYKDQQNRLKIFIEKVIFEYEDARSARLLYRDGLLIKSRQALDVSYSAYESGNIDFTGLLDAQRQYLNFELEHETALSKQAQKDAELKYLIGNQ